MLPSVRPTLRSWSSGVHTFQSTIARRKFGAYSAKVSIMVSAAAGPISSHDPSTGWTGPYIANIDMAWCPGGAIVGS